MENHNLEKKIRDWAASLGFALPDGSRPPVDYFGLLTATPNRRNLWETIIESVLPRSKVERMRNRIIHAKMMNSLNSLAKSKTKVLQEVPNKWDMKDKKIDLEKKVEKERNTVIRLEENILTKASDLIFEICKLAELEKNLEELNDKVLIFKLFPLKQKKMLKELESKLTKVNEGFCSEDKFKNIEGNLDFIMNQILSCDICRSPSLDHNCSLLNQINNLYSSGMPSLYLWEEVIKYKKNLLQQFSEFLIMFSTNEKNILSEKESEIEKNLNQLVTKLKQKVATKSLQVMMNSTKSKSLDSEIENLKERLILMGLHDKSLSEANSFISPYKMNQSYEEKEKRYKYLTTYLDIMGLETYKKFLKEVISLSEDKKMMVSRTDSSEKEPHIQNALDDLKLMVSEINSYKFEEKNIREKIFDRHNKLVSLQRSLEGETEALKETKVLEETVEKLKYASVKHVDILMEIPTDAFRILESSSGRVLFECESESHWLANYGGESKQFFSAMLIPPMADFQKIISVISHRKQLLNKINKFTSDRDKVASFGRKIQDKFASLKYDSRLCEKNFKESDGILWNIYSKTEHLRGEIDYVEKVLKYWIEQPYRLMITEQLEGKNLKEYEELYRKGKTE